MKGNVTIFMIFVGLIILKVNETPAGLSCAQLDLKNRVKDLFWTFKREKKIK